MAEQDVRRAQDISRLTIERDTARARLAELDRAGAPMANILYNLAGLAHSLPDATRKSMHDAREAWDVAVHRVREATPPARAMRVMRQGFLLGFAASGEGYNGEYPFDGEGFEADPNWVEMRDRVLTPQELPLPDAGRHSLVDTHVLHDDGTRHGTVDRNAFLQSTGAMTTTTTKRGDWMQTFTGRQFWPLDPDASSIEIEDIAHALSMQCRYAGHCLRFYSVAEHCVHLARHFERAGDDLHVQRWALMHDAAEAYLIDVPRPVKPFLAGYATAEDELMRVIAARFGLLPFSAPEIVKRADNAILADEAAQNMSAPPADWRLPFPPLGITLQFWTPEEGKRQFLQEFDRLEGMRL